MSSRLLWGPPNLLTDGYWGRELFHLVKRPGREAGHSTTSEQVKDTIYTFTPPIIFMAW